MPKKTTKKPAKKTSKKVQEPDIEEEPQTEFVFDVPQYEVQIQDAPFWRRTVAYLIDLIFFYFIFFQIFMMIYLPQVGLGFDDVTAFQNYIIAVPSAQVKVIIGCMTALIIFLFYFMLLEKNFKTTIGKKIMRLQVKSDKEPTYLDMFIRNLTKTVALFFLPIDLIGWFFNKQRFTEKLSGTKVIYYSQLLLEYGVE